jgi:hypothetical protein
MRGTCSTAGLLRFHGTRNTIDCPAVLTVRRLGALPFCKTNVPQVPIGVLDHISPNVVEPGTAGIATFCLSRTKTGMQFGS